MNTQETYQEKYHRAKTRVGELKAFYNHLVIYSIINILLVGVNYYNNGLSFPWFLFPLLGWGIGIASHAITTFSINPFTGKNWEERKIQEILEKEQSSQL